MAKGILYLRLVEEPYEGSPLDFDGLSNFVVEADHEVEEVGFPEIGRRLLRKVDPPDSDAENYDKTLLDL